MLNLIHGYQLDNDDKFRQLVIEKKFDEIISELTNKKPLTANEWNVLGVAYRGKCKYTNAYGSFFNSMKMDKNTNAYFNLGKLIGELNCFFRREDIFNRLTGRPNLPEIDNMEFSCFKEGEILNDIFSKINVKKFYVDIGAGDGVTFSNTYPLISKGWKGVCAEPDGESFYSLAYHLRNVNGISLVKEFITPKNVVDILKSLDVPKDFGFLSLDIDSYDYYVLENLLSEYSPSVICTEINELFPPPIKFALKYTDSDISGKFVGHSVSMVEELLKKHKYKIHSLEYNNLIAIKGELTEETGMNSYDAYDKGFKMKEDWYLKFIWNGEKLNEILNLPVENYPTFFGIIRDDPMYHFSLL